MHPTQIQVTDTVTPACAIGIPAIGDATGTDDSVRDVLLATASYLAEHGWNQHTFYADTHSANPAACTVGALSMVCYGYPAEAPADNCTHPGFDVFESAMDRLHTHIGDTFGYDLGGVYGFNDTPGRVVGDVFAILWDAAIGVPAPCCACSDRPMVIDWSRPFDVSGDGLFDPMSVSRAYVCRICGNRADVEAVEPDDRNAVQALFRAWVQQQPHDGDPHVAGTSPDCDTCDRYCFCTDVTLCLFHDGDDGESPLSWDVPGQPQFGAAAGAALGGAE